MEILKDDRRRAELIATLEAIVAAQAAKPATPAPAPPPGSSPAPPATTPAAAEAGGKPAIAIPLAPDSLGANLLVGLTDLSNSVAQRLRDSFSGTIGLPRLAGWVWSLATDPVWRDMLVDAVWRLAVAFACGLALSWLVRVLLRRPRAALIARAPMLPAERENREATEEDAEPSEGLARAEEGQTEAPDGTDDGDVGIFWRRLPLALGCLGLDLLSVIAFLLGAHAVTATPIGGTLLMQLVLLAPLQGFALWQTVLALGRATISPDAPAVRLLDVSDAAANFLQRRLRWLAGLVIFGDAVGRVGWLLGMSAAAHAFLEWMVLLLAHLGVAAIVVRQRREVAAWLLHGQDDRDGAAEIGGAGAGGIRRRLAPVWHWLALAGLFVLWLLLLLEDAGGPIQVLGLLLGSGAVLVAAWLANGTGARGLNRLYTPRDGQMPEGPSGLHIWLRAALRVLVGVLTALAMLHVWGVPAVPWLFATALGRQILGGLATIGVTLAIAIAVWETANFGVNRHIARLHALSRPARAARLRTLLPMLRSVLFIGIVILVGLTVLSQLGVNIAPLLAGAGVLGIAIGLGSQKLMQDVVTGLFLLLENVMQVGDVVTLGGQSGVVEELSVRSIRLRAEDGSVHVIPFSAVTTVTNMTRDFGHAVIEARVAVTEDYERVAALLREVFEAMRAEPLWQSEITGDLDMMGLVRLDDTSMVIKCRVRCGPFGRWRVLREFQRRMQLSFTTNNIVRPPAAA